LLTAQDKRQEVACFSRYADAGEYNVLTASSSEVLVARCVALGGIKAGALIGDLGCGSGVFTHLLRQQGLRVFGLDLSVSLLAAARRAHPDMSFVAGDVEGLPLRSESVDGLLLSGLIHHLPDPRGLASECYRVLKPGGAFAAFDPNRRNPFMWLYRDRASPFYSANGVTPNERPIVADRIARIFRDAGFTTSVDYVSVQYRHIASSVLRVALPVYHTLDALLFRPAVAKPYRAFVLTSGIKP